MRRSRNRNTAAPAQPQTQGGFHPGVASALGISQDVLTVLDMLQRPEFRQHVATTVERLQRILGNESLPAPGIIGSPATAPRRGRPPAKGSDAASKPCRYLGCTNGRYVSPSGAVFGMCTTHLYSERKRKAEEKKQKQRPYTGTGVSASALDSVPKDEQATTETGGGDAPTVPSEALSPAEVG